jgi:hypothetical protein
VIRACVGGRQYQAALAAGGPRYDLDGSVVSEVTEEQATCQTRGFTLWRKVCASILRASAACAAFAACAVSIAVTAFAASCTNVVEGYITEMTYSARRSTRALISIARAAGANHSILSNLLTGATGPVLPKWYEIDIDQLPKGHPTAPVVLEMVQTVQDQATRPPIAQRRARGLPCVLEGAEGAKDHLVPPTRDFLVPRIQPTHFRDGGARIIQTMYRNPSAFREARNEPDTNLIPLQGFVRTIQLMPVSVQFRE